MTIKSPSLETWKKLYGLIAQVGELAPWEWMLENDLFAIQLPNQDEYGFVSVMGNLGEHLSIAVYLGVEGLKGFLTMQEFGDRMTQEHIFLTPQVQASLVDRDTLDPDDRAIIKKLGLKFRGKNAWPWFRSFQPACFPWHIDAEEAEILIRGLEQTLNVAPRFENDPDLLFPTFQDGDYFARVQKNGAWEDAVIHVDISDESLPTFKLDEKTIRDFKKRPGGNASLEIDAFMSPTPVQDDEKERPYFPYLFLVADHQSGMILNTDILSPIPSLEAMWNSAADKIVNALAKTNPREIFVREGTFGGIAQALAKELGIKAIQSPRLQQIDNAREELERFSSRLS